MQAGKHAVGQVAIDHRFATERRQRAADGGGKHGGIGLLQARAIGNRAENVTTGGFDDQIAVGRRGRAQDMAAINALGFKQRDQRVAIGIRANRGQQPGRNAMRGQCHGHVQRHAAGAADDRAGNIIADLHAAAGRGKHIPQGCANAQNRRQTHSAARGRFNSAGKASPSGEWASAIVISYSLRVISGIFSPMP